VPYYVGLRLAARRLGEPVNCLPLSLLISEAYVTLQTIRWVAHKSTRTSLISYIFIRGRDRKQTWFIESQSMK